MFNFPSDKKQRPVGSHLTIVWGWDIWKITLDSPSIIEFQWVFFINFHNFDLWDAQTSPHFNFLQDIGLKLEWDPNKYLSFLNDNNRKNLSQTKIIVVVLRQQAFVNSLKKCTFDIYLHDRSDCRCKNFRNYISASTYSGRDSRTWTPSGTTY